MAEKSPSPAAVASQKVTHAPLKTTYSAITEYEEAKAVRERGRQRLKWLAIALVVLAVVGAGVGLGVGLGTREKKHSPVKQTPSASAQSPGAVQNASNITTSQLKFLPESRSAAKVLLQNVSTDEAKAALQHLNDVDQVTPEVVREFLDFFDKKANLTARGINVAYLKAQAYNVARWLRSRPELSSIMDLLRKYANNPTFSAVELAQAVDQVVGNLNVKDFQTFISWKADKDDKLSEDALSNMIELTPEEEAGQDEDPAAGNSTNRRLLLGTSSRYNDPINQVVFKAIPNSYINNPKNVGLKGFQRMNIPVVFHVLSYVDSRGYTYPYNAYGLGKKPGQLLIQQMNRAYAAANLRFVMREWRNNPKVHSYLKIGQLEAWQACAAEQEACTCSLAKLYNVNPTKVVNIWVIGSTSLQFSMTDAIAYSTIIPGVMDSCKDVMQWNTPDSTSRHLWISWDMADTDGSNSPYAFNEGGMTLIHELGHYLGLLHTHQGDCQDFDKVSDTPANLVIQDQGFNTDLQTWCINNWSKPVKLSASLQKALSKFDSCKNKRYIDNIGNFMSYVHAACYRLFTPGQIRRMQKTVKVWHKMFK